MNLEGRTSGNLMFALQSVNKFWMENFWQIYSRTIAKFPDFSSHQNFVLYINFLDGQPSTNQRNTHQMQTHY